MRQLAYLLSLLLLLASTHPLIVEERIESSEEVSLSVITSQHREAQSISRSKLVVISPVSLHQETAYVSGSFKRQDPLISGLYIKHRILRI